MVNTTPLAWLLASLLSAGSARAATVTASDGGTAVYGACNGVAIGFKGVSDTANDFSTSANNWLTFTFSNVNYSLTVDATVGSGSGLHYFVYQSGTSAVTSPRATLGTDKFGTDTYMTNSLGSIMAYGGLVANRSPQYQATITANVPTQPPAAPTGVSAAGSNAAVILAWTASVGGATSYNVKRSLTNGSGYATVTNVTATRVLDGGLTNGTPYYYVVSGLNSIGESTNSAEVSATPLSPPAAPAGVSATASNVTVTLTWMASGGATSYQVKRSLTSGSGYATVTNVPGTNVVDGSLAYGTTYYYVVSAANSGGESANSSEVSATTAGLPGAVAITNSIGASVVVGANGIYQIHFAAPVWVFLGNLALVLGNRTINSGADTIGGYSEITFNYTSAVAHAAGIRLYNNSPVVMFNDTTLATGTNDLAFPHLITYPMNFKPYHLHRYFLNLYFH